MFRPLELYIGLRYTRAKRRNQFISLISLVSMLGIALGVTAMITVVSVMNGFETELRARILGMISHATVSAYGDGIGDWGPVVETAQRDPRVVGAAPFVEREAMVQAQQRISGGMIRGIVPDREPAVSDVHEDMTEGQLSDLVPGEYGIILGRELAMWLGVGMGDSVMVYAPQLRATPAGMMPTVRRFTVKGTFAIGMHEYDRNYGLVHIEDAARLFRVDGASGVRLKLEDMFQSWAVARDLTRQLDGFYRVDDWTQQHSNFFRAVKAEKLVMFVILSLIIGVAGFNLVSSLVMLVTDKQADIAILRTLGMTPGSVMGVFMIQGMLIGTFGTLLGTAAGIGLTLNLDVLVPYLETVLGFEAMPADVYYISDLPAELRSGDVILVTSIALLFSVLATIYPAWRAARTEPAAALRYE